MRVNGWLLVAAVNGGLAVAASAYAAHGLGDSVDAHGVGLFRTGARLHMWHALALLGVSCLAAQGGRGGALSVAGWAFLLGMLLFSGGLYLRVITGIGPIIYVVPVGGTAYILGWVALAWFALGRHRER